MFWRMVVFCIVGMSLVACNRENINIQRNPGGGVDINVEVTEAELNLLLSNALAQGNGAMRNVTIDLLPGTIVISGEAERQDGSGDYVSGSFTLGASIVDGTLATNVLSMNIDGWSASDTRIVELNRRINDALQGRARRDNRNEVTWNSIVITDMTLTFNLTSRRSNN